MPILPWRAVKETEHIIDEDAIVIADSGNNCFWLPNYLQAPIVQTYYGPDGVGGVEWATPAAISTTLVADEHTVGVTDDDGFTVTMMSAEAAVERGVAPTFAILDDTSLGMVRQI